MIKVAVADDFFNDDPYQPILDFEFFNEEEAISFVKEMIRQGKKSLIYRSDVKE